MHQNFPAIIQHVFSFEGGYVDHPQDPGGATMYGITLATLKRWRGGTVTKAHVQALTREEAATIYAAAYWHPIQGDALPSGVDCSLMDFGVNAGVKRAVRLLQRLVEVPQDGILGVATRRTVDGYIARHGVVSLITTYAAYREAYYRGLHTFAVFGKGWLRRNKATKALSLQLAQNREEQTDVPTS